MSAPALSTQPWISLAVDVGPAELFGSAQGFERRRVPILGGRVTGRIEGRVLPGGADWQRVWPDGTTELEAHYAIETATGDRIEVTSVGLRAGPEEAMRALLRGEAVDPALIYFRSAMRFLAGGEAHGAFARRLFVGVGRREPTRVLLDIHAVD